MEIISSTETLVERIVELKSLGKTVGFTPTMGALHAGHFSLIRRSLSEVDITVCSIFVNPTQFNNADDLVKYPRTLDDDCQGLESAGCHIVFTPTIEDIYPGGEDQFEIALDLKGLDTMMEGAHRPGHFEGVVQVVKRLLDIVTPDRLYMGQKDFQQFTIIRYMIKALNMPTILVVCETMREEDGLAMSSRNRRLTKAHRDDAPVIYRMMSQAKEWLGSKSVEEIEKKALEYLDIPGFKPEYFTIINGHNLETIDNIIGVEEVVACTAVWAGEVRLIDNMILKN